MEENLNELESVEQELAALRDRLQQSFTVIDSLAELPAQLESLVKTYKQLQDKLEESQENQANIGQLETDLNQRFSKLEKATDSKWRDFKGEVFNLNNKLITVDNNQRKYNSEVSQQLKETRNEIEEKIKVLLQEWESYKETNRNFLNDLIDAKLSNEIDALMNQLSNLGFNPQFLEKVETELRMTRTFLQNVDQKLRRMRNYTIFTIFMVGLAIIIFAIQLLT